MSESRGNPELKKIHGRDIEYTRSAVVSTEIQRDAYV